MSLKISRILHAGYFFEYQDTRILFDPILENPFSVNCFAFPAVEFDSAQIESLKVDAIFISHYHDDHCSLESLNLLNRDIPIYIFCLQGEMLEMIRQLGFHQVIPLTLRQPIEIGGFEITAWQALDSDVDCLLQIRADGRNVLNVVDSWIDAQTMDQLLLEKPWDLLLWPFQTLRELEVLSPSRHPASTCEIPPEWILQLKALSPKAIVPSSCQFIHEEWSWYNQHMFPILKLAEKLLVQSAQFAKNW